MAERLASDGWERWPQRKTLDGQTYLCRWCAKPLTDRCTSYCSRECQSEIETRCIFAALRMELYHQRGHVCEHCGINLEDLETFFNWYESLYHKVHRDNRNWHLVNWWPGPLELRKSFGYAGNAGLWECNHKLALIEGGNLVDPENLEILCLKCHKVHTAALRRRMKKSK